MAFQNEFASQLFEIARSDVTDAEELYDMSEDVLEVMVEFGTETDDNLNCQDHIEYGMVQPSPVETEEGEEVEPEPVYGFKIKGKNILMSDVMNALEALQLSDLPQAVRDYLPGELTDKEWDAVTRLATMVFLGLERVKVPLEDDEE